MLKWNFHFLLHIQVHSSLSVYLTIVRELELHPVVEVQVVEIEPIYVQDFDMISKKIHPMSTVQDEDTEYLMKFQSSLHDLVEY